MKHGFGYATPYYLYANKTYKIKNNGEDIFNVMVKDHSDKYVKLSSNSFIDFTPAYDGYLYLYRISTSTTGSSTIEIYGDIDNLKARVDLLEENKDNEIGPSSFDMTTIELADSLTKYSNSDFNTGSAIVGITSVTDYTNYIKSSSYADIYAPLKIRQKSGKLLYNLYCDTKSLFNDNPNYIIGYIFDINGLYLGPIKVSSYEENGIPENAFYILIKEYHNPRNIWKQKNINIEWLNDSSDITYTIGNGGTYTKFLDALNDLQDNDSKKTIYILPGEYDLWEEYGGDEYFNSIENPSELNWRDVCPIVPPNTTIIGIGEVILKFMPTPEQIGSGQKAFLFSPLNISGTCTIKNIKIECQNCRYAIHDETSGKTEFDEAIHIFENVRAFHYGGTYGVKYSYGAGHNKKMTFKFKNCEFWSYANIAAWSSHDWPAEKNEISTFIFDNCLFMNPNNLETSNLRLSTSSTVGRLDNIRFNNCYFSNGIINFSAGNLLNQYTQGYDVTCIGCNQITPLYTENIKEDERVEIKQYNIIK